MLDNALFQFIRDNVLKNLSLVGLPSSLAIKQSYQPTNQGINTTPTAYLFKVMDKRYGFPRSETIYVEQGYTGITDESGQFITTETGDIIGAIQPSADFELTTESGQVLTAEDGTIIGVSGPMHIRTVTQRMETTFQFNALATQDPKQLTQLTASDILNRVAQILQDENFLTACVPQNLGIERITDIRSSYFEDDRNQFEQSPSFDFTMTHELTTISVAPTVETVNYRILRV